MNLKLLKVCQLMVEIMLWLEWEGIEEALVFVVIYWQWSEGEFTVLVSVVLLKEYSEVFDDMFVDDRFLKIDPVFN